VLQVVERFNQRLFDIEDRLRAVEEGLKEATAKAHLAVPSLLLQNNQKQCVHSILS
jgi:hypothetical protein